LFTYSLLYLSIAAIAGISMAFQGSLNSVLAKKIGFWEASFIVHFLAAVILIILLLFNIGKGNLTLWKTIPWYLYLGGILGIIITYTVVISIPRLGVAVATTAIITGQVLTAAVIDYTGILGLERIPFT
jgi:bacterial/archaeal transporter family-2 protein